MPIKGVASAPNFPGLPTFGDSRPRLCLTLVFSIPDFLRLQTFPQLQTFSSTPDLFPILANASITNSSGVEHFFSAPNNWESNPFPHLPTHKLVYLIDQNILKL